MRFLKTRSSALLFSNDRPGAYPPSYYAATTSLPDARPKLKGSLRCDVAVIGAGFTGLSAALHLAQRGYDVVLLDAHRVGWGASGRNGGQLAPAQREDQETLEQLVGPQHAKQLWSLGRQSNRLVKSLIERHAIDCDFKAGLLYTNHKAAYTEGAKKHVDHMKRVYDYQGIRFYDRRGVEELLGTRAYDSGVFYPDGGHLHPLKYALGLGKAAIAAGVRIFENSPVHKVTGQCLYPDQGRVRFESLVFACNGYLGGLHAGVARRVMPINNFMLATEPLSDGLAREVIAGDFAVADSKFVVNYYRKSADNRLLFGGGESYGYRFPADIKGFVRAKMLKIYPQLAETKIDYGWGGTLAITMNRMPHLERLSGNQWSASGYSGSGVGMATFSGKLTADAVDAALSGTPDPSGTPGPSGTPDPSGTPGLLGNTDTAGFDVMAKIPTRRFPGGRALRRPLLALAMTRFALRDRL